MSDFDTPKPTLKRGGYCVAGYVIRQEKGGGGNKWWVTLGREALRGPMTYDDACEAAQRYDRMTRGIRSLS